MDSWWGCPPTRFGRGIFCINFFRYPPWQAMVFNSKRPPRGSVECSSRVCGVPLNILTAKFGPFWVKMHLKTQDSPRRTQDIPRLPKRKTQKSPVQRRQALRSQQIPTHPQRSPQIPTDPQRSPQIPTERHRSPQIPADPHRSPQIPTLIGLASWPLAARCCHQVWLWLMDWHPGCLALASWTPLARRWDLLWCLCWSLGCLALASWSLAVRRRGKIL